MHTIVIYFIFITVSFSYVFKAENNFDENFYNGSEVYENSTQNSYNFTEYEKNSTDNFILLNISDELNLTDFTTTSDPQKTNVIVITDDKLCTCDLIDKTCEINCCCDQDCSTEDQKVFSECIPQNLPLDDQQCYKENIFYKNNTVHKGIIDSKSQLFCIVFNNLKSKLIFKDILSYKTMDDFKKLNLNSQFSWNLEVGKQVKPSTDVIKAGNILYVTNQALSQSSAQPWTFSSSCFSRACDCDLPIEYLKDTSSSCIHSVFDLEIECTRTSAFSAETYSNFCFHDSLKLDTTSSFLKQDSNQNNSSYLTTFQRVCVLNKAYPVPYFNATSNKCHNVVISAHYIIMHNGVEGIDNAEGHFEFSSIGLDTKSIHQRFEVSFHWMVNNTITTKRSGNPGYKFGLPLIVGKSMNSSVHNILPSSNHTFTILRSSSSGLCDTDLRRTVTFGRNIRTGCLIQKTHTNCRLIQDQIYNLLSDLFNETFYISAFGNPSINKNEDWVKILHEGRNFKGDESKDTCDLILDTEINIAYAAVGRLDNPQFKVIGLIYKYKSPQLVDLNYSDDDLSHEDFIYLTTAVNFFDVTEKATPVFKKIPVVSAKLPHDFFYPFLLSSSQFLRSSWFMNICLFIYVILFVY